MTQEQLHAIDAWRDSIKDRQFDEEIVNAMWLAEEMWEQHHTILRSKDNRYFGTYMMEFCKSLMEYIWMPHTIVVRITEDLNDAINGSHYPPENFSFRKLSSGAFNIVAHYIVTSDSGHDNWTSFTMVITSDVIPAEALTAILNHANKAGHDAVTRLSA